MHLYLHSAVLSRHRTGIPAEPSTAQETVNVLGAELYFRPGLITSLVESGLLYNTDSTILGSMNTARISRRSPTCDKEEQDTLQASNGRYASPWSHESSISMDLMITISQCASPRLSSSRSISPWSHEEMLEEDDRMHISLPVPNRQHPPSTPLTACNLRSISFDESENLSLLFSSQQEYRQSRPRQEQAPSVEMNSVDDTKIPSRSTTLRKPRSKAISPQQSLQTSPNKRAREEVDENDTPRKRRSRENSSINTSTIEPKPPRLIRAEHFGNTRFKCRLCPFSYRDKQGLSRHWRTHALDEFACPVATSS
ncbi:hypothetical protein PIIN_08167 [Serendipita indica DSM 11827]|uniref:C2H2-type domain-containing protein n=1 Tax=Serendipita indica (strain DSM 11827) TaxID=1109443 RepID=G4TSC1_SERID|nr:hypothetical protein PIIN_08167 [Serendipita indica DSM 11827]